MVKFYLDDKGAPEAPIFLAVHYMGKRVKAYVGKKIAPDKWDVSSCRANPRKFKLNVIGFNGFLQGLSDSVQRVLNDNKPLTKAVLRDLIDKANGKNTVTTFFGFAEAHLRGQIEKNQMKQSSAKGYRTTLEHLRKFRPSLTFDDINLDLYDRFVEYLTRQGLSANTIGANIKRWKWFLSAGLDRDVHSNIAFKKKAFAVPGEPSDQTFLTRQEIKLLASAKLPERLKRVADCFVLNCNLGMRYSDLLQIQKGNFHNNGGSLILHMVQGKTSERIHIPVPPAAMSLLKAYDFTCPVVRKGKLMSVQRYNDFLKEAAELAGLNALETIRAGKIVEKVPKYKLLTSHSARRSFATNLFLEGVPIQSIMSVTGHRLESTFNLYIRADQIQKSKGLADHYKNSSHR